MIFITYKTQRIVIKWRYTTTASSRRQRGWSLLLKFPISPSSPSRGHHHPNFVTITHWLSFIVLLMYLSYRPLTQDIVRFSLLDWEMESYWIYFSVTCFFHSRLRFWDLSICCVHTNVFNLTQTSLGSSCITLIQKQTQFILSATSSLLTFIYNNVWLYRDSSMNDLGWFHIFAT